MSAFAMITTLVSLALEEDYVGALIILCCLQCCTIGAMLYNIVHRYRAAGRQQPEEEPSTAPPRAAPVVQPAPAPAPTAATSGTIIPAPPNVGVGRLYHHPTGHRYHKNKRCGGLTAEQRRCLEERTPCRICFAV